MVSPSPACVAVTVFCVLVSLLVDLPPWLIVATLLAPDYVTITRFEDPAVVWLTTDVLPEPRCTTDNSCMLPCRVTTAVFCAVADAAPKAASLKRMMYFTRFMVSCSKQEGWTNKSCLPVEHWLAA